jgi:hypothetical protein
VVASVYWHWVLVYVPGSSRDNAVLSFETAHVECPCSWIRYMYGMKVSLWQRQEGVWSVQVRLQQALIIMDLMTNFGETWRRWMEQMASVPNDSITYRRLDAVLLVDVQVSALRGWGRGVERECD